MITKTFLIGIVVLTSSLLSSGALHAQPVPFNKKVAHSMKISWPRSDSFVKRESPVFVGWRAQISWLSSMQPKRPFIRLKVWNHNGLCFNIGKRIRGKKFIIRAQRKEALKPGRYVARLQYGRYFTAKTIFYRARDDNQTNKRSSRNKSSDKDPRASANNRCCPEEEPGSPSESPELPTNIFWAGDFENGDLSQWDLIQRTHNDRIQLVTDNVREGRYAAKFTVTDTDHIGSTDPRAELGKYLGEQEGEERYYRWYTYFPHEFPSSYPDEFITFTQWRAEDESEAFTSFMVWGDQIELRRDGTRWSTPLVKGQWHEFIYNVKWSPNPEQGFIRLWYDGELVLAKTNVRTMAGSPGNAVSNYLKQGLYKSEDIPTGVIYHDGLVSGDSLQAVQ